MNSALAIGPIDPVEVEHIEATLQFFNSTAELIEANNGVFRFKVSHFHFIDVAMTLDVLLMFKYLGLIRNLIGMEAWARSMILEQHPRPDTVKTVAFLTNRKRDVYFGRYR